MKSGGGHVLGSSDEDKWRCQVCTFLNVMSTEACRRCKEPTTEEERAAYIVKAAPVQARASRSSAPSFAQAKASSTSKSTTKTKAAKSTKAPVFSQSGGQSTSGRGSSRASASSTSSWPRSGGESSSSSTASRSSSKGAVNKGKINGLPQKKSKTIRRQPKEQFHKGDLGYKPKKNNIHRPVQSRLNHDTVSYRAKFEKEGEQRGLGNKGNIFTIGSTTKNGFVSSTRYVNKHDEKAAPRPAKYSQGKAYKGQGKRQAGLLGMLQQACNSTAVASLKHTGTKHIPTVKANADGTYTKLAM